MVSIMSTIKLFYILIPVLLNLSLIRAGYRYMGVRNVNQMEPPSLESSDTVMGGIECEAPQVSSNGDTQWQKTGNEESGEIKTRVFQEPPQVRMIERRKEHTPLKEVQRMDLAPEGFDVKERALKSNVRTKIETYTESYVVTTIKTRVKTRKRMFIQTRKLINQRVNKPVMIIRRKVCKERQVFERVIPRIVETRQIINRPFVESKIVEGPVVEVPVNDGPNGRSCETEGNAIGEEGVAESIDGQQIEAIQNFRRRY